MAPPKSRLYKVRTTMRPDEVIEVSAIERADLERQGLIVTPSNEKDAD